MDSVGGVLHQNVLNYMNFNGRVIQLGNLAMYNAPGDIEMVPANDLVVALKVFFKCYFKNTVSPRIACSCVQKNHSAIRHLTI